MCRTTRPRIRLLALAAGSLLPGCFLLSPEPSGEVQLQILATVPLPESGGGIGRADHCRPEAEALLRQPDSLMASARVELIAAEGGQRALLVEAEMTVGDPDLETGTLPITGELSFVRGGAGDRYGIEVDLMCRGNDPRGSYEGNVVLDSGLDGEIRSFDFTGDSAFVHISAAGLNAEHTFPAAYDSAAGLLQAGYRDSVTWQGRDRELEVLLTLGLEPVVIYTGSIEVDLVPSSSGETHAALDLDCPNDSPVFPGDVGERLVGTIVVRFTDDDSIQERGRVELERRASP